MHTQKAGFFFGSGISRLSDAAGVQQITEALLQGNWECNHLNRYFPRKGSSDNKSARLQDFLRRVEVAIGAHLAAAGSKCNYEHLYAAVRQLEQDVRGEIVNPLIADFHSRLKGNIGDILAKHNAAKGLDAHTTLLADACKLIQWVVFSELEKATTPRGLDAISHVAKNADKTNIFTLNHDLLVEAELDKKCVGFSDGFRDDKDDVVIFNGTWDKNVSLYKLHGSINWHRAELPDFEQYVKPKIADIDHLKVDGRYINLYDEGEPMFLTGSMVKEQAYNADLVGDMFCTFRNVLTDHRRLVVCGYGWQDRVINLKLEQWLRDQPTNRMLILHNNSLDDITKNQFWASRWPRFSNPHPKYGTVRARLESKWLSECSGDDLLEFFNEPDK